MQEPVVPWSWTKPKHPFHTPALLLRVSELLGQGTRSTSVHPVVLKAWPRKNANSFKQRSVTLIADSELKLESPSTNLSRLEKAVLQCTFSCCPPAFLGPILDGMAEAVCPQDICMYVCMTSIQLPSAASNHSLPHPSLEERSPLLSQTEHQLTMGTRLYPNFLTISKDHGWSSPSLWEIRRRTCFFSHMLNKSRHAWPEQKAPRTSWSALFISVCTFWALQLCT